MPAELMLNFPDPTQVAVHLHIPEDEYADMTSAFAFVNPLTDKDIEEIRWYLEDYGTGYRAEPDDERADRAKEQLRHWGAVLFEAVFKADDKTYELYRNFRDEEEKGRLLTIAADHPAVLSLPWELLRPASGVFLFGETPRISIRRRLPMAGEGRRPHKREPKPVLRLLFIVSRPEDAGFINPRTDPQAVLDALEQQEQQRVEVEFLRPATLKKLEERLRDEDLPAVDIIHFDGHGVFDRSGTQGKEAAKTHVPEYMKDLLLEAESKGETTAAPKHTGYLLFEDEQGKKALVEARLLGELFHRQRVGLVVLSACQSAAMDAEDAMSSVAAWLTHAGVPGVLAMTHKVLVATAGLLFARFYSSLFQGEPVGKALEDARAALYFDPKRGERRRGAGGNQSVTLELHDWFLPALYQTGPNRPLLSREEGSEVPAPDRKHNLPKMQESGFFGRTRELWRIERALTVQGTRRFSVTGFGGQGKTYLALEAGYWLLRTGLFRRVCFVSFAGFQGVDPVGVTISTLATVLEQSLPDAEAAEQALKRLPCLLILDNLETLADGAGLPELLTAATRWSEAGDSRVLLTSRQPDFNHPDYRTAGTFEHQCLHLKGLGEQDALDWFGELMRLPPKPKFGMPQRSALVSLFQQVDFHPLSIGLLAQQLKERRPAELGERLEALLEEQPADREDRSLLASLELSLERLPERCREWLPRLGVFQGGGLEEIVVKVAGMEEYPSDWSKLQYYLGLSGLMQEEWLVEVNKTWLRFHPTLAPALWQKLGKEEQTQLTESHWNAYYQLSRKLYWLDRQQPQAARIMAEAELFNLLRAVSVSLQTEKDEKSEFAIIINWFLDWFGLRRERHLLAEATAQTEDEVGSQSWFLARSNIGEQLWKDGQIKQAEIVFKELLAGLKQEPNYQRCLVLHKLCRCYEAQGQLLEAEYFCQQAMAGLTQLELSQDVQREISAVQIELAELLTMQGKYAQAKKSYLEGLLINQELGERRNMAVINVQLGTLALEQYELTSAAEYYQAGLRIFRDLKEFAAEAVCLHQLGRIYEEDEEWDNAELVYRQSALIEEKLGNSKGAASSWGQLACICEFTGRLAEAKKWYSKALAVYRLKNDQIGIARILNNLANLLAQNRTHLDEASNLAEESLEIAETLDPVVTEIWRTYQLLAQIADRQGRNRKAAEYRAKSRQTYAVFPGASQQVQRHKKLIAAVIASAKTGMPQNDKLEEAFAPYDESVDNVKVAIHCLLNGERNEFVLCEPLYYMEAAIIRAILEGIDGQG